MDNEILSEETEETTPDNITEEASALEELSEPEELSSEPAAGFSDELLSEELLSEDAVFSGFCSFSGRFIFTVHPQKTTFSKRTNARIKIGIFFILLTS